jgi:hypothetical protein
MAHNHIEVNTSLTRLSLESLTQENDIQGNDSLSRFLDSPLSEYPVDLEMIQEAARKISPDNAFRYSPYPSRSRAGSARSVHSSVGSSNMSSASTKSVHSNYSRSSRRGRKQWPEKITRIKSRTTKEKEMKFYCTFCPKFFSGKFEWNRHEESVHFHYKAWVCPPVMSQGVPNNCPYCLLPQPSHEHLVSHNYYACSNRAIVDRTFFRLDGLLQHIKQRHMCHGKGFRMADFESWCQTTSVPPESPALRCGFCGQQSEDWDSRVSHIAQHLTASVHRAEWWLGRIDNEHKLDHRWQVTLITSNTQLYGLPFTYNS